MPKRSMQRAPLALRILLVIGAAFALALLAAAALSALALAGNDPTAHLSLYGEILFLLCMLLCGFFGARLVETRRLLCGMAAAGGLLLIAFAFSLVLGTKTTAVSLILAAFGLALGAAGAALGMREKRRGHRR